MESRPSIVAGWNALPVGARAAFEQQWAGVAAGGLPCGSAILAADGSVLAAGRSAAERFLDACALIVEATSFGGVVTTAERRARWGGDAVPEGFIRLSVGCEDADDILDDLAQALDRSQDILTG